MPPVDGNLGAVSQARDRESFWISFHEKYFGAGDTATRRRIAAIVDNDRSDPTSASMLMAALDHYNVGALVMPAGANLNEVLSSGLTDHHFERHDFSGYAVWLRG